MNLTMNAYSAAETTSPISAISSVQLPLSSTQKPKSRKTSRNLLVPHAGDAVKISPPSILYLPIKYVNRENDKIRGKNQYADFLC